MPLCRRCIQYSHLFLIPAGGNKPVFALIELHSRHQLPSTASPFARLISGIFSVDTAREASSPDSLRTCPRIYLFLFRTRYSFPVTSPWLRREHTIEMLVFQ